MPFSAEEEAHRHLDMIEGEALSQEAAASAAAAYASLAVLRELRRTNDILILTNPEHFADGETDDEPE